MSKILWEILVPTVKDATKPGRKGSYTTRYHRIWDQRVREITGGLTIQVPAKGAWVSPSGELFLERMIPVKIFCTKEEIEKIADMTAAYYNQQAIMYYAVSTYVVVKHY